MTSPPRQIHPAAKTLRDFLRDRSGSTGVTLALTIVPALIFAGGAVDYSRVYSARAEIQAAADAAVLAGTQQLSADRSNQAAAIKTAEKYFSRNFTGRSDLRNFKVAFTASADGNGIVAKGSAELTTSFLALANMKSIPLFPASGTISAATSKPAAQGDLEVSMMLDVTGSMCNDGQGPCTGGDKISGLKTAAKQLVDTVVWKDQSTYTSRVAIVPFSTRVRVAPNGASTYMKQLTNLDPTWKGWYKACVNGSGSGGSEDGGNWTCSKYTVKTVNTQIMPCVTERFYNTSWSFDLTDDAPGSGKWLNAHDGGRMPFFPDSSNTAATSQTGKTKSDPSENWNYESGGPCADLSNANTIMPLTSDTAALKAKIDGLEAFGATGGVLGTAFAWYMLSPNFKSVWTGTSEPKAYSLLTQKNSTGAPKLRKVAVLMTDGVYNTFRGWKDQDQKFIADNAIAMCNAMKAKGIEIYTVGFNLNALSVSERATAENTLKSCGSTIDHFYQSFNAKQLAQAFSAIGAEITGAGVRLTQ